MSNKIETVNEFVAAAVLEGVASAPAVFMNQLEEALRMDVAIEKSGSVDNYLQEMIDEKIAEVEAD